MSNQIFGSALDRRSFFQLFKAASATYLVLRVTGCTTQSAVSRALAEDPNVILVYDLLMHGYFNPSGEYLGDLTQPLLATQIRDYKQITLDYTQDTDGHTFVLGPEHFAQLLKGQAVEVLTTVNNYHNHIVRIDPADQFPGGNSIQVRLAADGTPSDPNQPAQPAPPAQPPAQPAQPPAQPQPTDKLYAALDENDQPNLYIAATTELQDGSVEVCANTADACNANATLWQPLQRFQGRQDKQIFVTSTGLALNPSAGANPVEVMGVRKSDGQVLTFLMNLLPK